MVEHDNHDTNGGGGAGRWVFLGFVLVAAYFLITEHRAHVYQYLPFLLVLACPLMHLFHGHGGHRREDGDAKETGTRKTESKEKHGGCH